ncbi:MAG: hypothetical protein HC869_02895 [Rhodospirillales bacterium]|nr:hypothetical protein [Rhodospirillales bacterium]
MIVPGFAISGGGAADCDSADPACVQQRVAALRTLTGDRQHAWVAQAEPLRGYSNGTRLFAYRITRSKLSCDNLARGLGELRQVRTAYAGAVPGLSPASLKRTRRLVVEVHGELAAERHRRCRTVGGVRGAAALT